MTGEHEDETLRRMYGALLHRRSGAGAAPDPDRLLALVEGRGEEAQRLATLDAAMADAHVAREFELLRALAANRPTPTPAWRRPAVLVPLAAAAVLVAVAIPVVERWRATPAAETMRDVVQAPAPLAPAAEVAPADARTFRWTAVPGARSYVLEILTSSGRPLFTTRTTATSATLPPDVVVAPGIEHWWWVTAELADGTQRRSAFRRLLVRSTT